MTALPPALANAGAPARWEPLATVLSEPVAQDDQLPNSAIPTAIANDAQGFVWIGTQNGLARWDGQRFRIFNSNAGPGALPDSQIECLLTDREGRFWIGTASGGLALYDRGTGAYRIYTAGPGGLSHAAVHALADAPGGRLWVGTEAGLDWLDPVTGRVVQEVAAGGASAQAGKALAEGVYALAQDRAGDLWIGTHGGLVRRDHRDGSFALVPLAGALDAPINALMLASDGRLWVGAESRGAFVLDPANRRSRAVPGSKAQALTGAAVMAGAGKAVGMRVRALLEPKPGVVWLGTYDDGVIAVDPNSLASRRVRLGASNVLYGDQNIRALHRMPDGLVFIAGNSAITRYDPRGQAFASVLGGLTPTAVLTGRNAVSIFEAPDHRIWVSQMTRGVDLIDADAQRLAHLDPSPGGLPKANIRSYAVLADRSLLLGTDAGLFHSSLDARQVRRLDQPGRLPDARAQALLRDGSRLWLGGRDGLWGYRLGQDGRLTQDVNVPTERLSDRRIDSLALDRQGDLWIATDNGLNRYDPRTGAVRRIRAASGDRTTPRGFISSLTIDRRGRLWASTFGEGLFMTTPGPWGQTPTFLRVSAAQGLPNDNVNQTLEDDHGNMWASTDNGLARIDPQARQATTFRAPEGVAITNFFYNSGARTSHGELLFGGRDGVALVRPDLVRPQAILAPLVVTEVREGGRPLPGDPFFGLARDKALAVPPGQGALEVHFAALDYAAPDRMRYAYRLQRIDGLLRAQAAWVEADARARVAAFTNMAPGRYRLEIRAFDPDGGASARSVDLPIQVLPAWWQTIWFNLLEAVAVLGVVLLLIWWRTAYLHRRRQELEQQVEERTRDLAQARARAEDLARTTTDFLANMSHEIRTPLNGVVAVADLLARSDLNPKERQMAEIIRASGDTLQRLLSDILDAARIESGKISIENAPFQAGDMVRAVAGLWQLKCDEKGVGLQINVAPEIDESVMGDLARVRQILTNLLSNAVKFTETGEIRLTAERTPDGGARFSVADTGIGFAAAEKTKVLGRFEQADSSITRRYGGTGLGLSICRDLAVLMGGELDCESAPGKGSRFWLDLPLAPVNIPGPDVVAQAAGGADFSEAPPLRILVADDHPTNRKVVQLMLEACEAELTEVENGAEALEAFRGGGYDLILMDMQMPVMDGLAAVAAIRRLEAHEARPRTPIIMLTANALPEHVVKARAAGADLHLAKPLTSAALFEALNAVMTIDGAETAAA